MITENHFKAISSYGKVYLNRMDESGDPQENTIIGYENQKEVLETFFKAVKEFHTFSKRNMRIKPRLSALLTGPPGTGKTTLVLHYAKKFGIPVFLVFADSLISQYLGETLRRISELLNELELITKQNQDQPLIIFFDELDAIASERSNASEVGEIKRAVITFLQRMDDLMARDSLISFVGATNHPESLDKGVWRRFSFCIKFGFPPVETKRQIIHRFIQEITTEMNTPISPLPFLRNDEELESLTREYSGADIERAFQFLVLRLFIDPTAGITEGEVLQAFELAGRATEPEETNNSLKNLTTAGENELSNFEHKGF